MPSSPRWAFVALVLANIPIAAWADDDARLKMEGVAVLRAATALESHSGEESSPCRVMSEWSAEAVPYDLARKVFGLKLRADLTAASPVPDSYAILSAVEPNPARLCSKEDLARQVEQARTVLPSGTKFFSHVASYTFPAFTKAVVVWTALYSRVSLGENAGKPGGIGATVTALTFARRRNGWTLVAQEVMGQT